MAELPGVPQDTLITVGLARVIRLRNGGVGFVGLITALDDIDYTRRSFADQADAVIDVLDQVRKIFGETCEVEVLHQVGGWAAIVRKRLIEI